MSHLVSAPLILEGERSSVRDTLFHDNHPTIELRYMLTLSTDAAAEGIPVSDFLRLKVISNKWFERWINLTILANIVTMACYDYSSTQALPRNSVLNQLESLW